MKDFLLESSNYFNVSFYDLKAQTDTTNTPSRIKTPLMPPLDATALDSVDLRDRIVG